MKSILHIILLILLTENSLVQGNPNGQCPPGVKLEECQIDPCEMATCPGHTNAQCVPNYCGGCIADFYVDGMKVTCEESKISKRSIKECPDADKLNCFVDPCFTAECPAHPQAKCKANYCGECHADFFDEGGHVVDCHEEMDAPKAARRAWATGEVDEMEDSDARSGASRPRFLEL